MTPNPSKRPESLAFSLVVLAALALIAAAGFVVGAIVAVIRYFYCL